MEARWNCVKSSITLNGYFSLTNDELVHSAKYAWRNSSKCIGRMHWKSLVVKDCRDCSSLDEMFKRICEHIIESSNNGRNIPMISIFPQKLPGKPDPFRIWNPTVIMYAGYQDPDNIENVVGNRSNIEFTQVLNSR